MQSRLLPPGRPLLLLLILAASVKAAYLLEYASLPFLRGPIGDSVVYLAQARAVRACRFDDPTLLASSPLYGYFLAALGDGTPGVLPIIVQLLLGCLNLALLSRIGTGMGGPCAGLTSAALYLGYGLLLFYESKILSETLGLTLSLLALTVYLGAGFREGRLRDAALCGVILGLAILARASLLLCAPFFLLASLLPWSASRPWLLRAARRTAALALGLGLVLGANGAWNLRNTGLFVPVILVSRTIDATLSQDWNGSVHSLSQTGRAAGWDVVDQAAERIRRARAGEREAGPGLLSRIDVVRLLRGAPPKLYRALSDSEILFQYGYQGERSELRSLDLFPVSFGMLLLLGSVGALLLIRSQGAAAVVPHLPLILGALLTVVLYHPSSRYRLPMVLPLSLLGGHGLAALATARGPVRTMQLGAVAACCAVLSCRTLTYELGSPLRWEMTVAHSATAAGLRTEAERRLERAQRLAGGDPAVEQRIRELRLLLSVTSQTDSGRAGEPR